MAKILVLFLVLFSFSGVANAQSMMEQAGCSAEYLVEPESGTEIYSEGADEARPPASMVKVMVAYLTYKRVAQGAASWDDVVTTSAFASKVGGSQVYLKEKEQFTLHELMEALMIQSANDAAVAIAEYLGGSQEGFVEMMNEEAKRLGMNNTEYHSAHGLPPAKDQKPDLVSAKDMAILATALIKDYPEILEISKTAEKGFRNDTFIMRTHNHLINSFPGCDGLKTGYYAQAGFCVTATATRNGTRMIAVVMGCKERKNRDIEAARLLSQGFAKFRSVNVIDEGAEVDTLIPLINAPVKEIKPIAKEKLSVVVKIDDIERIEKKVVPVEEKLQAPISKGTKCAEYVATLDGKELGKVDLVIPEDQAELGFKDRLLRKIGF